MNKKGMTLVELIVAIAILTIIMSFVAIALRPVIQSYGVNKALVRSKDIANNSLAMIKNQIRDTKGSISTSGDGPFDLVISSNGKSIQGIELPASYFSYVKKLNLSFVINDTAVTVHLDVDGYKLSGTYKPYKPGIISAGTGNSLYIVKEPPQ